MSISLDLSKLSLMDALDLAILIEEEAHQRYKLFASQIGRTGNSNDAGVFFASMAENEAKHGNDLLTRRIALFGKTPMKVKLIDLFDVEAPEIGAPRRGMSTVQACELGLAAEKKAYDFYDKALPGLTDPEVRTLDFISRLVALVPKPRVNLTRYHGVFAPHSKYRARVTPAQRGTGKKAKTPKGAPDQTSAERHVAMTWAQRLKRVFNIDIETCSDCGGEVRIISCIEDPAVIRKILAHLDDQAASVAPALLPECRAPPLTGLFRGF